MIKQTNKSMGINEEKGKREVQSESCGVMPSSPNTETFTEHLIMRIPLTCINSKAISEEWENVHQFSFWSVMSIQEDRHQIERFFPTVHFLLCLL